MRFMFFLTFLLLITNCSSNKNFQSLNKKKQEKNKSAELSKVLEKKYDITKMTFEEYKIYLDDYTKINKYPNLNK